MADHARRARRRSHLEHAETGAAVSGAGRAGAGVRARAADSGPDKKRLSKRHGATSVGEYETQGYLPEAMVNFLALLGWSPGSGDQEVFSRDELVARFTLEGISGGNAVFNPEKLDWFNQQHIVRLPAAEILARLRAGLEAAGLVAAERSQARDASWIERVIDLLKPRARKLADLVPQLRPFRRGRDRARSGGRREASVGARLSRRISRVARRGLRDVEPFDPPTLEAALRGSPTTRGIKAGALIHATRVAVDRSGREPGTVRGARAGRPRPRAARLADAAAIRSASADDNPATCVHSRLPAP